jgi:hypothetical protein
MSNPAMLVNSRVPRPSPELRSGKILDDATAPGQEIRCTIPSKDTTAGTDPMRWRPYVTPDGFFYPKRGDDALIALPPDGPPWIVEWAPAPDAVPDSFHS